MLERLRMSIREKYEIPDRRPAGIGAVLLGSTPDLLGIAAVRLQNAGMGALCVTRAAEALNAQDGLFTMLVRGENENGDSQSREEVIQSIVCAMDPEKDYEDYLQTVSSRPVKLAVLGQEEDAVGSGLLACLLYAQFQSGFPVPKVRILERTEFEEREQRIRSFLECFSRNRKDAQAFGEWLKGLDIAPVFPDRLCGWMDPGERALQCRNMNYEDELLLWAEPDRPAYTVLPEDGVFDALEKEEFAEKTRLTERVFEPLLFLTGAAGYLCGCHTVSEVMRDEEIRQWIGKCYQKELLEGIGPAERVSASVVEAFGRLDNSMNRMEILDTARSLIGSARYGILPLMEKYGEKHFDVPVLSALAVSATLMLYAGVRRGESQIFTVSREIAKKTENSVLRDREDILERFSRLSHDMPSESLAYAGLRDIESWNFAMDRIEGLEEQVMEDIASIQQIGFRETMKRRMEVYG